MGRMRETNTEVADTILTSSIAWQQWRNINEKHGLNIALPPKEMTGLRARAHSFQGNDLKICFFSSTIKKTAASPAETAIKPTRQLQLAPYELCYTAKGCITIKTEGGEFLLTEGAAIFLNKTSKIYINLPAKDCALTFVQFSKEVMQNSSLSSSSVPTQIILGSKPCRAALMRTLEILTPSALQTLPVSSLAFAESLCSLLIMNLEKGPHCHKDSSTLSERVKRQIRNNYKNPDLSPDSVSAKLGISRSTLYGALHNDGLTFYDFLFKLRVRAATKLLESKFHKGKRISEVAYQVGFTSARHFSAVFKKSTGKSPKQHQNITPMVSE
ncbi:MAG: helix-turn-helix domain-containing protein [Bdellovibrionales bacterium]